MAESFYSVSEIREMLRLYDEYSLILEREKDNPRIFWETVDRQHAIVSSLETDVLGMARLICELVKEA